MRQRVHGFVEAQPLDVRPVENADPLPGHLRGIEQRGESDVARLRRRLDTPDQVCEREAVPGDDHGPRLDAAHPIDALLEREPAEQVVDADRLGPVHLALDRDGPGPRPQRSGQARWILLGRAELVEVVVRRDLFEFRPGLVRREGARAHRRQLRPRDGARFRPAGAAAAGQPREAAAHGRGRRGERQRVLQEAAAVGVDRFRRDLGGSRRVAQVRHGIPFDGMTGPNVTTRDLPFRHSRNAPRHGIR